MLTVIYLIIILGLLIFVHELGHFIAAKSIGVYVHEFALGMGPKIFSFKRKNKNDPTVYSLRLFPIGGFCAMAGETEEDSKELKLKKNQYMCNRSKLERFIILIAGVTNNVLLAIILLFFQSLFYGHSEQESVIGLVAPSSPIAEAGVSVGDKVIELNGYKINTWDKLIIVLNFKNEDNVYEFTFKRNDGTTYKAKITPQITTDDEGNENKVFGLGAGSKVYKGFFEAIKYSITKFWSICSTMWLTIGSLFNGKLALSNLSGPVGMYSIVGESAKIGFASIIYLTAYLSVNLAVVNGIPFPAFDGGRVLFIVIEELTGKKVDQKIEGIIHTIGFALLMLLMLYITIQDVIKLFG